MSHHMRFLQFFQYSILLIKKLCLFLLFCSPALSASPDFHLAWDPSSPTSPCLRISCCFWLKGCAYAEAPAPDPTNSFCYYYWEPPSLATSLCYYWLRSFFCYWPKPSCPCFYCYMFILIFCWCLITIYNLIRSVAYIGWN